MGVWSPPVVEDLDVAHGGPSGFLAGVKAVVVVELVLQRRERRLCHGVVPALAGFSHGLADAVASARSTEFSGRILCATIAIKNCASL